MLKAIQQETFIIDPRDYPKFYEQVRHGKSAPEQSFYLGVQSTGVVCRPGCSARTPRFEHCNFFPCLYDALLEGYRPCKRCKPLRTALSDASLLAVIDRIDADPHYVWKRQDFLDIGPHFEQEDRRFHRIHGFRVFAYARARRLGLMIRQCRFIHEATKRSRVPDCIFDGQPASDAAITLSAVLLKTPIGTMLALASSKEIYLLEFLMRRSFETELRTIKKQYTACILAQKNDLLEALQHELDGYFSGTRHSFSLLLRTDGTPFQEQVWQILRKIPCGTQTSYTEIAQKLGKPRAHRSVGRANGANRIAILIPCHRILRKDGELGGYGGGLARKSWLLNHETPQNTKHRL